MKDTTFFIWVVFICCCLLIGKDTLTWNEKPGKPHIQFGQKIEQQGKIFDRPMIEVSYGKRQFPTYSPLINNRPKSWGTYLR
jgi:hypothetical protein